MVKTKVVNLVATADLRQKVDIEAASKFSGFLHDSEIYGGRVAYFKNQKTRGKVTIFPSGKMISVGSKSVKEASDNFDSALKNLLEYDLVKPTTVSNVIVRNIVASVDFETKLDLEDIVRKQNAAIYEPERFPGVILRLGKPSVSVLLFASGKAVIAGAKDFKAIDETTKAVYDIIRQSEERYFLH